MIQHVQHHITYDQAPDVCAHVKKHTGEQLPAPFQKQREKRSQYRGVNALEQIHVVDSKAKAGQKRGGYHAHVVTHAKKYQPSENNFLRKRRDNTHPEN